MFELHLCARMYKKCQEASFIGSFVCRPPSVDKMFEFHLCARVYKKCQEASFIVSFVCHSHLYQYRCIPTPLYWPPQPTNPFRVNYKDASQLLVSALFTDNGASQFLVSALFWEKDAFQLLVSALEHWSDWRPSEKTDSASNSLSFNRLNTIVHNTTYLYECSVCEFDLYNGVSLQ